jgi:hypothetical protein
VIAFATQIFLAPLLLTLRVGAAMIFALLNLTVISFPAINSKLAQVTSFCGVDALTEHVPYCALR